MKSKNANENVRLNVLLPFMYAATVLLIIMRTFQLTRYIDSETGFITGGNAFDALFLIIIAVAVIAFAVVSYLSAESKKIELVGMKDKLCSIASVVFGASLVYDSFVSFKDSVVILNDMYIDAYVNKAELFKVLMSTGALPYALQSVFAVASAVYLFILAKSFSNGSENAYKRKYIALAPIVWAAFKIITRFVKQISYIKVSDLFLELMMLALMILFFVALAQVVSGVYSDDSRWRITALGLGSALVSLSLNIPRLVLTVFAGEFVNKEYPFNLADTVFAVFAICVVMASLKGCKNQAE